MNDHHNPHDDSRAHVCDDEPTTEARHCVDCDHSVSLGLHQPRCLVSCDAVGLSLSCWAARLPGKACGPSGALFTKRNVDEAESFDSLFAIIIVAIVVLLAAMALVWPKDARAETIGPELVTNGNFEADDYWALGYSWQILPATGALAFHNEGYTAAIEQPIAELVAGHTYRVRYTISGSEGSTDPRHWFRMRGTSGYASCAIATGAGTFGCDIVAPAGAMSILVRPAYGFGGVLDDVSVREITP